MSPDERRIEGRAPFSLSPPQRGEGGEEGQGAHDVDEPIDSATRVRLPNERSADVDHRSPLSPSLSPEYVGEGERDTRAHATRDDRAQLAEQQAALVRALAGQSDAPEGFDGDHVATAAASLLNKRRRGVEKTWPGLAESLGERFGHAFGNYARTQTFPAEGHAADGRLFAQHLRRLGLLSDDGRLQLLLAELGRRPVGIAYLPGRREFVIAFPTFSGATWVTLPIPPGVARIFHNRWAPPRSRIARGAKERAAKPSVAEVVMATTCPSCGAKNLEGVDECANCGADLRTVDLPKPVSKLEQAVMLLPLTSLQLTQMSQIESTTTLEDAVRAIGEKKLDMLAVVDSERLVGLFSVRDILTRVGTDYASKKSRPVREFITKNPETLPPDAPINYAINLMDVGGYRHVPVVRDGYLLGVVSARDVLRYLVKQGRGAAFPTAHRTTSHGVAAAM